MASAPFPLPLCLFIMAMAMSTFPPTPDAIGDHGLRWVPMTATRCQGSIVECMADGEFGMDSETHRRILATSQYISYKALQRNTVPCSHKGASYYNCKPGAGANPYSRGCAAITRCRTTT